MRGSLSLYGNVGRLIAMYQINGVPNKYNNAARILRRV